MRDVNRNTDTAQDAHGAEPGSKGNEILSKQARDRIKTVLHEYKRLERNKTAQVRRKQAYNGKEQICSRIRSG